MNNIIKNYWNESSDAYFQGEMEKSDKLERDPSWAFPEAVYSMVRKHFSNLTGKKVLVPSSGDNTAVFAFHLLGAEVTSCDISENQLVNAKKIADAKGWDIRFICGDSMELPAVKDSEYDLVYTSNGVHVWISDLPKMHGQFFRVLKNGGRYIMFETHPFIRPMGNDEAPAVTIAHLYEDIYRPGNVPNYAWRIMDIFNSVTNSGFVIEHMEEFHPKPSDNSLWFYKNEAEALRDEYKRFDWKQNPWAALPQWIGLSAVKKSN